MKPNCSKRARSIRPTKLVAALSIVFVTGFCGCSSVSSLRSITSSGTWNDTVETMRNRSYSAKAWYHRQGNYCNMANSRDFQAGFRAGYEAIADGKPGCPPSFPPKQYWGWEYQSADGQSRTAAWFQGYPYGVQAAREDGMDKWSHLMAGSGLGQNGSGGCGPNGCGAQGLQGYGQFLSGTPENQTFAAQDYQLGDGPSFQAGGGASSVPSSVPSGVPSSQFPVYNQDSQSSPFPVTN